MGEKMRQGIIQAVVVALLLAVLGKVWTTYETVVELRHDVDALYSLVDDVAKKN